MPATIRPVSDILDNGTLNLGGAAATTSTVIGGVTYVFVAGQNDSGISVFALAADGTLTPVFDIGDDPSLQLGGVSNLITAVSGGVTYLYAAGFWDSGISAFQVNADGSLTPVQDIADSGAMLLANPSAFAVATIGARSFLYATSQTESGLTIFEIGSDGMLMHAGNVADADNVYHSLQGLTGVTATTSGGESFLVSVGIEGLDVFRIDADGQLTRTIGIAVSGGMAEPNAVAAVTVGGVTYLAVTSAAGNDVDIYRLFEGGLLGIVDRALDTADVNLAGARSVVGMTVGARSYIAVAGTEGGASLFEVTADGALAFSGNFTGTSLAGSTGLGIAAVGNQAFLLATGHDSNSLEVAALDPANEPLHRVADLEIEVFEGQSVTITAEHLDYDDLDQTDDHIVYTIESLSAGTLKLDGVTLGAGGTFTQADVENGLVSYTHDGNDLIGNEELRFTVSDGQGSTRTGQSFAFWIIGINDAPVVDLNGFATGVDGASEWAIGDAPTALAPSARLIDPDTVFFSGATLTVAITGNGEDGDRLSIRDDLNLTIVGSDISYQGVLIGTFTGGTGGDDPLVISLNADASTTLVRTVMRNITFENIDATPSTAQRTISFTLVDGGGTEFGGHDTGTAQVLLDIAQSEIPVDVDVTANLLEDDPAGTVTLIVHDTDSTNPAHFTLDGPPGHGTLQTLSGGDIIAGVAYEADHYDATLGAWVLTLRFVNQFNWSGQTSFTYSATDSEEHLTDGATATINVAPVADMPYVDSGVGGQPTLLTSVRNVTSTNTSAEDSPVVIALATGGSLLVWQSAATGSNIRARYYDAYGNADGAAFNVTATGNPVELQPAAAARADGGFAIAWVSNAGGGGNVIAAFYEDGATSPSATVTVAANASLREIDPTVTAAGTGFVVTWAILNGANAEVHAQRYTADGTAVGSEVTIVTNATPAGTGASFDPPNHRVSEVSDGDIVVVTQHGTDLHATLLRANGTVVDLGTVNAHSGADQAAVARTADGGFVIVWHQTLAGEQDIYGRVYDANGVPGAEAVLTGEVSNETMPEVVGLADGRYAVTWLGNNGVSSTRDVFVQTFNADGTPANWGAANLSFTGGSASETQPTITVDSAGFLNVAWLNNRGSGNMNDVFLAQVDPGLAKVAGNAGQSVLLPTRAYLGDVDGSEMLHSITIANLPDHFSFQVGARDPLDPTHWVIDRGDPDGAAFLDNFLTYGPLELITEQGHGGAFTLEITITTTERDDPTSTASTTVPVPVEITVVPNEAPVLDLDPYAPGTGSASTWTEGDGPQQLAYYASFSDDNSSFDGATVTAAFAANGSTGDRLTIYNSDGDGIGQVRVTGHNVYYEGNLVGTWAGGANGDPLVVTFNEIACHCSVQTVIGNISFNNNSDTPATAQRIVTVTLVDGAGTAMGGHDTATAQITVDIITSDDDATAGNDTGQAPENGTTTVNVLGNDSDPDSALQIAMVAGQVIAPGGTVTLASGAIVTLNANGTLSYDPNGAYTWLISTATAAATGASNSAAIDSFTYTLADGVSATVQVTVTGVETTGDVLLGNSGANVITGTNMNDIIDGGGGADRMIGGLGDDIFYVANPGDIAEERPGEGNDTVRASITYSLAGQFVENLVLTGNDAIDGTGNGLANSLTGNDAANTLNGGDGNDVIDGGGGIDTMIGGLGDDLFYVDQAGDAAVEYGNSGYDTVRASISYSLAGQYIEKLVLTGGNALNATGNSLANVLIGNAAANTLDGGDGNDDIDGGGGADTMIGGLGDDIIHIDQLGDLAVEAGGSGSDTVRASISYSLAGQYIESLILTGNNAIDGTGNSLANTLTGNGAANILTGLEGNDTIDGGTGADTMIGGAGDDIYFVGEAGDLAVELNGLGTDTVNAAVTYSLAGQFIENLVLTGANAIDGTGNKLANILTGNGAANTLSGGEGNDTINGDGGIDTMIGGLGDDIFYVDDLGDLAMESNLQGHDAVISSITYSLSGQYIEDLTLTGSADIDATGNKLANILTGNSGANQIHGGLGADMLTGGGSADGFWFDTALDGSFDTITDFQVGTDMFHLDRGIFTGLLDSGPLGADAFALGNTAQDADDRILYDSVTGKIYYDEDGSGAAAAVVIAQVNPGTALTDTDFTLF